MSNNLKILYMDDDDAMRENMTELGEALDYDFTCVKCGEEALDAYEHALENDIHYDAVILDLTIKGSDMQGEDTLKALLEVDPKVKAIVFSGHSNKPIVANYKDYGFVGRLNKPVMIDNLCSLIEDVAKM